MKSQLQQLFSEALASLVDDSVIPKDHGAQIRFDRPKQKDHGDFATNLALLLAKPSRCNPRELAGLIVDALPASTLIAKTDIAGPGFINIFLAAGTRFAVLESVFEQGAEYGCSDLGQGQRVLIEFVSANPTGPLHVGHGRGAAFGDTLARVMRAAGYAVSTEYYINDNGRQMDILALSVWLRYLEMCGESARFPENGYRGDYVLDIAAHIQHEHGDAFRHPMDAVWEAAAGLEPEPAMDALIARARTLLGTDDYEIVFAAGLDTLVADIRDDLKQFNVEFDHWFSERSLEDSGRLRRAIEELKTNEYVYESDGAWWFRATAFGDEKDRVVIRENDAPTYFASDIAYHIEKFERGYDRLIDVWGADHHGYITRVKGALASAGYDPENFIATLVQFAALYRGGEKISMSTRGGQFVTLRELRDEVGTDAARFFYVQRKPEQHMDFDLDLAKSESADNPVYYVQYAHARVCSVFREAAARGIDTTRIKQADVGLLTEEHEIDLANLLAQLPETIALAARHLEPHRIVYYLREVANSLHTYYNAHNFLGADEAVRLARLALIAATRQVIANGLTLLGVSAPDKM